MLGKINEVQKVEDIGILNDDDAEMGDSEGGCSQTDDSEASKPERMKQVYRLKQEIPTRWNSCLAMLKSLLEMRKEVDNCIKMTEQYEKCLKGSEWALVEELIAFLSRFQYQNNVIVTNPAHSNRNRRCKYR